MGQTCSKSPVNLLLGPRFAALADLLEKLGIIEKLRQRRRDVAGKPANPRGSLMSCYQVRCQSKTPPHPAPLIPSRGLNKIKLFKTPASEMAPEIKAPASRPGILNTLPGAHVVEGENQLPWLSSDRHTTARACAHTYKQVWCNFKIK